MSLGQAGHLLPREQDARYAGHVIGGWAAAILEGEGDPRGTRPAARPAATAGERLDERVHRAVTRDGYATDAWAGGFPLRIDEPEDVGGTDTGPKPNELLRVALAACTTITVRMYADRKKWPLQRIEAEVDGQSKREGGVMRSTFQRRVRLVGDLDDEQRARLMEIADRCPVHRTLEGEVEIETKEVRESA